MNLSNEGFRASPNLMRGLLVTSAVGMLCFLLGLFIEPVRAWGGYLVGFASFTGMALAGGLFLTVLTLSGARWATALRRIPEAMTAGLPFAFVMAILLLFGVSSLYEWDHESIVEGDHLLEGKQAYLNWGFFSLRTIAFFVIWIWLARGMVAASRRQDVDGDPQHKRTMLWKAVLFLPIFGLTFSMASIDWLQSLEPHWFSTIYGLVTLSGVGTSGLAIAMIVIVMLRRSGAMRNVITDNHYDDLGKIGIALSLFWGYIWYCQYMLIWYTNMPEETPYYFRRMQGSWQVLMWVNVLLNWAIPFFALMPKKARRSGAVLVRVAAVMLLGNAMHLFMLIAPPLMGDTPTFGLWELGPIVASVAFFFWVVLRGLGQANLVPERDPHLEESLHHHC